MAQRALPLLVVLLAAGLLVGVGRSLFPSPEPYAGQDEAAPTVPGQAPVLVGAPREVDVAAFLEGIDWRGSDGVRAATIRERASRDPTLFDRLAALAKLSDAELARRRIGLQRLTLALAAFGPDGARVLAAMLGTESDLRDGMVLQALRTMGPDAAPATASLVAYLQRVPMTRAYGWSSTVAFFSLQQIGPAAADAVPFLLERLQPPLRGLPAQAARALAAIAGGTPDVLRSLRVAILEDTDARPGLLDALATLGPAGAPLVPDVVPLLDDYDPHVRRAAAAALGASGVATPYVVGALARLLQEEHGVGAGQALAALGEAGRAALVAIARDGETDDERLYAFQALLDAGADVRPQVDVLLRIAESDSDRLRSKAVDQVARMDPPADTPEALTWLEGHYESSVVGRSAAHALARFPGTDGVAFLLARAKEGDAGDKLRVAWALLDAKLLPEEATALALAGLENPDGDGDVRSALRFFTATDAPADSSRLLLLIERHLHDEEASTRQVALNALCKIGEPESRLVPILVAALDDDATRWLAASALTRRPSSAATSVPALLGRYAASIASKGRGEGMLYVALATLGPRWSGTAKALDEVIAAASPVAAPILESCRRSFVGRSAP